MKIFDKATLKLTAIYTSIIMVISLGFSVVIGTIAIGEARRPFRVPNAFTELRMSDDFTKAYEDRIDNVESKVWFSLALINVNVFIVAVVTSYLFSRWTLKPIEEAMSDESRFVSDASHELRTPLATMRMENEVLLRDKQAKEKDYKEQVRSNLEEIDKLRKLTDTLLKLGNSATTELSNVAAGEVAVNAIDRISRFAEANNIAIHDNVHDFNVMANADALTEIIYIFLDNAVKYSPNGSTIEVSSDSKRRSITVRDQGDGIADKDMANIFNRFYRADESRNSEDFGLGLSLAKRLAEQMNARVSACNNQNAKGASFTVSFK